MAWLVAMITFRPSCSCSCSKSSTLSSRTHKRCTLEGAAHSLQTQGALILYRVVRIQSRQVLTCHLSQTRQLTKTFWLPWPTFRSSSLLLGRATSLGSLALLMPVETATSRLRKLEGHLEARRTRSLETMLLLEQSKASRPLALSTQAPSRIFNATWLSHR